MGLRRMELIQVKLANSHCRSVLKDSRQIYGRDTWLAVGGSTQRLSVWLLTATITELI